MTATCALTGRPFTISEREAAFCQEHDLPLPQLHPFVRLRQLMVFRNRGYLYNGSCALSNRPIISGIPPNSGRVVYDVDAWLSDAWDWRAFARPYDFSRPFFEQFAELLWKVPIPNLAVVRSSMENSDYTNGITAAKNCYLVLGASHNEDCLYCRCINHSRNLVDCLLMEHCELCFDCRDCHNCYQLRSSEGCHNCSDSTFLLDCQGCKNCYGCVNLSQKQFCFFNEQLSREEYQRRVGAIDLGSYQTQQRERQRFRAFIRGAPRKFRSGRMNENCSGNFINNSKGCQNSYYIQQCEDIEWSVWVYGAKNSFFHVTYGSGTELIYNSATVGENAYNVRYSVDCWPGTHDVEYCNYASYGSHDCFGCAGVKRASYCILNKEYTKAEYLELVPRIRAHMRSTGEYGRFFPVSFSPHAFNRSDAFDFFPISRASAEQEGYSWMVEDEAPTPPATVMPDHIRECSDAVLAQTFISAETGKRYKVVAPELEFYRAQNLPLPRLAPMDRIRLMSAFLEVQEPRTALCHACRVQVETSYPEGDRPVLCEECYQELLAG